MRYVALACDYDGTIAHDGAVADSLVDALARLKDSGRRLLLVTGRELDDLCEVFARSSSSIVSSRRTAQCSIDPRLARWPDPGRSAARVLRRRRLQASRASSPCRSGAAIVATWEPHRADGASR